jgi:hypothetical protein
MSKKPLKTREAKPGELRGIKILETLERMSKRAESRMDVQRLLDNLTPDTKIYARYLVMSGPSGNNAAAKALGITLEQLETAMTELETKIDILRGI